MKILLDECIDWRFARDITGHEVRTAREMAWTAIQNGKLLALASEQFDVFVTVDRNLSFQQNVHNYNIAVMVLSAKRNRLVDLKPLVPALLKALATAQRGQVTLVGD